MDSTALPKGHIIGWAPPPKSTAPADSSSGLSKSAKKNAKRKEKRDEKKSEVVRDNWEDDDDGSAATGKVPAQKADEKKSKAEGKSENGSTAQKLESPSTKGSVTKDSATNGLATELEKLKVS